jgi:hypothetical protein
MEPIVCGNHQWSNWFMPRGKVRRICQCVNAGCLVYIREGAQPPEVEPIFSFRGFHLVNHHADGASLTCRLGDEIEIELLGDGWEWRSRGRPYLELIGVGFDSGGDYMLGDGRYHLTKLRAVKQGSTQILFVHVDTIRKEVLDWLSLEVKTI